MTAEENKPTQESTAPEQPTLPPVTHTVKDRTPPVRYSKQGDTRVRPIVEAGREPRSDKREK